MEDLFDHHLCASIEIYEQERMTLLDVVVPDEPRKPLMCSRAMRLRSKQQADLGTDADRGARASNHTVRTRGVLRRPHCRGRVKSADGARLTRVAVLVFCRGCIESHTGGGTGYMQLALQLVCKSRA